MKYLVCSIRDAVNCEFTNIVLETSDASAYRSFSSSVLSSQAKETGLLYSHASDFSLWHIADFDSETGEIVPITPVRICEAGEI